MFTRTVRRYCVPSPMMRGYVYESVLTLIPNVGV